MSLDSSSIVCKHCRKSLAPALGAESSDQSSQKSSNGCPCGLCGDWVCKKCRQFLPETAMPFSASREPQLRHTFYCQSCFDSEVQPALDQYEETLEKAREVLFFFDGRRQPLVPQKKAEFPVEVTNGTDRDETILHLGFLAASQGYNAIYRAEVEGLKVRNEGYQKTRWVGRGTPAQVDASKYEEKDWS